jgi:hypothetical protein
MHRRAHLADYGRNALECGERFETNEIAEAKAFNYIEVFYIRKRRHSAPSVT